MEKFYLEKPSLKRKEEALEYINEFLENKSEIHGVSGLNNYMDDYENWLKFIEENWNRKVSDTLVPSHTYFFIRKNDNKIIGMIDIRLALNETLRKYGGNIGYSIRPTERRKGYNKINLYMALKVCNENGLEKVMLDCDKTNLGSANTIKSLGGSLTKEEYNNESKTVMQDYWINVKESLLKNAKYEEYISIN